MSMNEERARAVIEHKNRVIRLADELDKLIKLVTFAREAVEFGVFEGLGYAKKDISDKSLKQIKDIAATVNSVVEAKIRFDKAAKQMADSMTPEEERSAVVAYLKSLTGTDRSQLLANLKQWQERRDVDPDAAS